MCRRVYLIAFNYVFIFSLTAQLYAQNSRIELPSSFNPVGSGARALGMGGAFTSIADDATAASWNPAALIQLRRAEFAIVGGTFKRLENNDFATNSEASGQQSVTNHNLNYFSASMPCGAEKCGKNMIFSINYQNLYNFDKHWKFQLNDISPQEQTYQNINYHQSGDLYALGLAFAIQATEYLSIGMTLNLWNNWLGDNHWTQHYDVYESTQIQFAGIDSTGVTTSDTKESYDFKGLNLNLGLWWHLYQHEEQKLTLGLVLKTPFKANLKHQIKDQVAEYIDKSLIENSRRQGSFNETLAMPLSYGIGLSYQFSDALTMALDIYRAAWDDFELEDEQGNKFSPISDLPLSQSEIEATYQIRFGMEYRIISQEFGRNYIIPLRAGLFYDPAPAEGGADKYYGFSLGGGIAYKHYVFDMAYQYRFSNDVNKHLLPNFGFSQDVKEHTFYASAFYRF